MDTLLITKFDKIHFEAKDHIKKKKYITEFEIIIFLDELFLLRKMQMLKRGIKKVNTDCSLLISTNN